MFIVNLELTKLELTKWNLSVIKGGLSWQKSFFCFLSENECLDVMELVYIFNIFF